MKPKSIATFLGILLFACLSLPAQSWKAGAASAVITPKGPTWMAGYGSRNKPSEGVMQDLHAKALAIEDADGSRVVIVTSDLIGFTREISDRIARQASQRYELPRDRLVLTSSHTHTGPTLGNSLPVMYNLTPEQTKAVMDYTSYLESQVVDAIGKAIGNLAPANLSLHHARAEFAMNRRETTPEGVKLGVNREGPVDYDVPVLQVKSADGKLIAALYSYACHNTTLTGNDYKFHGDYAGVSQEQFEKDHPGAIALFMMGAGGDANPYPRGQLENAEKNGRDLAAAIGAALAKNGRDVKGQLRSELIQFPIPLAAPPSREEFEALTKDKDPFVRRHAEYHLAILDRDGHSPSQYDYTLQAVQFGDTTTMVALAGEVVVSYAQQLKEKMGAENTWPVAYANDVFAYIPTAKMLAEGGYEPKFSQIYYGMPGPWAPELEQTILLKAYDLVRQIRAAQ